MANETDWFAGLRTKEAKHQRCFWRRVGFCAAGLILAIILFLITGCAEAPKKKDPKVCYLGLIGQTEEGMTVVLSQCITMEEFKAAQGK